MAVESHAEAKPPGKLANFRAASAPDFEDIDVMSYAGALSPQLQDADCLYNIIAGSLVLGAGDGFFVHGEMAYSYTLGPEGVEVLELRHAEHFNIEFLASNPAFWAKALETVGGQRESWKHHPGYRI
jgi:hypothetical protein